MDRFFVRTAFIVVCAAWAAGCGGPKADEVKTALPPTDQSTTNPAPVTIDSEVAAAHALRVKGDYDTAAKNFGQLMLIAPDNPQVVAEYGKTLLQQGRPAEAIPFLNRALELQASDWSVYSALGVAYDQTNDHAHAKFAYERALTLKPGAPQVLNNYAMSRMLAGDLDGARRLMAQASTSSDPKIAANIALLASMKKPVRHAEPVSAPVAQVTVQHRSATKVADIAPPTPPKSPVTASMSATAPKPSVTAAIAPKAPVVASVPTIAATNAPAPANDSAAATGAPRAIGGVEMEKLPVQTAASGERHKSKHVVAQASKSNAAHAPAKSTTLAATQVHPDQPKAGNQVPVLRTAADEQ